MGLLVHAEVQYVSALPMYKNIGYRKNLRLFCSHSNFAFPSFVNVSKVTRSDIYKLWHVQYIKITNIMSALCEMVLESSASLRPIVYH